MSWQQGFPVVHFSAHNLNLHCHSDALKLPDVSLQQCSLQAEKWTSVSPWLVMSG